MPKGTYRLPSGDWIHDSVHVWPDGRRIRSVRRAKPDLQALAKICVEVALDELRREADDSGEPDKPAELV